MRMLTILLVFAQSVQGTVLIQAPESPPLEYRAALRADADLSSPTQHLGKQRPRAAQREALLAAFADAQQSFLDNSKDQAARKFQGLVEMLPADDWATSDREVFLHSLLRLAQMEIEVEKQNSWLTRALMVGDDIKPDTGLFPPPLLHTLRKLKAEVPRTEIPESWWHDGWSTVLLNGAPCSKQKCAGWPQTPEKVRITFLSDIWQPFTTEVESTDVKNVRPKKMAWVTGDCAKTQFSAGAATLGDPQVFWGLACTGGQKPAPALNLNPVASADAIPRLQIQEKSPAFYKSKWFWAGVGVLTAALIISNSNKQKEEKEPTTTYGHQ